MADLDRLETALRNADAAGDTAAAKTLASEIIKQRQTPTAPTQQEQPMSFGQNLERQAGLAGRSVIEGATALPGMVMDALSVPANMGAAFANAMTGSKLKETQETNQLLSQVLTRLGFPVPETTPEKISNVAIPMMMGAGAGVAKVAPVIEKSMKTAASGLMRSALKPTPTMARKGDVQGAIETLLDKGVNVTKEGASKLRDLIDNLNEQIKDKIANSTAVINKKKVADYLDGLADRFKDQANPESDLKTVKKAYDEFMHHSNIPGALGIKVQQAQRIKQGTYRALGDKSYGELKSADIEAQKTLARGLKEQIAGKVPEISGLNAKESKLLNALSFVERRLLVSANKNPGGLASLAKNPMAAAAFMADRSEAFKSLAARLINKSAKYVAPVVGGGAGAAGGDLLKDTDND